MNNTFSQNNLTKKELSWGIRYLLFQTVFLSRLLVLVNRLFPVPLSEVWLNFAFFSINLGAALWILHRFLKGFFPITCKQLFRILWVGILFFVANQALSRILGLLLSYAAKGFANINDQSIAALVRENFPLMAIGTVIFVPIAEECFFRGVLFRGIYQHAPWAAWVISVALFGFLHVMNYIGAFPPLTLLLCFLQYIPAGICLAAAYRLSGSLLCPILIHAAVNAVGILHMR
ncbi:MAG: CPBP family intramembrane metalloprotease [Oscillospiraceae bacterium]|nr:CPBP family intramembrane metalloprotease [Oscillospiraceae bacterium]